MVIFDLYDVISVTSNKPQITTINLEHTFHICLGGEADILFFWAPQKGVYMFREKYNGSGGGGVWEGIVSSTFLFCMFVCVYYVCDMVCICVLFCVWLMCV